MASGDGGDGDNSVVDFVIVVYGDVGGEKTSLCPLLEEISLWSVLPALEVCVVGNGDGGRLTLGDC